MNLLSGLQEQTKIIISYFSLTWSLGTFVWIHKRKLLEDVTYFSIKNMIVVTNLSLEYRSQESSWEECKWYSVILTDELREKMKLCGLHVNFMAYVRDSMTSLKKRASVLLTIDIVLSLPSFWLLNWDIFPIAELKRKRTLSEMFYLYFKKFK